MLDTVSGVKLNIKYQMNRVIISKCLNLNLNLYHSNNFSKHGFINLINLRNFAKNKNRLYSTSEPEKSKLRKFYEEYGKLGIGVYLSISVISVSTFYTAIRMGLDMNYFLEKFDLQNNEIISKAGPFALAYGIHKIFAPARILLAFLITPIIKKKFFSKIK